MKHFQCLEPYLESQGGVVHVRASDSAPVSTFTKAVRRRMAERERHRTWNVIVVDPADPTTHYVDDIILDLESVLGVADDGAAFVGGGATGPGAIATIGSGIAAGGDVHISNVTVTQRPSGDGRFQGSDRRARVERIGLRISEQSSDERLALIFVKSHTFDPTELKRIRRELWDQMLESHVVASGVLLIDIAAADEGCPDWPPEADAHLHLAERFDYRDRETVWDDISTIIADHDGVSKDEARGPAETLMRTGVDVNGIHALVSRYLANEAGY